MGLAYATADTHTLFEFTRLRWTAEIRPLLRTTIVVASSRLRFTVPTTAIMHLQWISGGFKNLQLDIVGLYAIRTPFLKTFARLTALAQ